MGNKNLTVTVEQILFTLPRRFRPKKEGATKGVVHFIIQGKLGGNFTVTISGSQCEVYKGLQGEPDCVVRTRDSVFIDIELGRLNPQVAFLMRRVSISNLPAFLTFNKQFIPYHKWQAQKEPLRSTETIPLLKGPLQKIQILDFSRLYPAPLATMWLGDLGAQVIKIEHPRSPDPMRTYPPFIQSGVSAGFVAVNRNKLSLALDFTSEAGREVIVDFIRQVDVIVESFRPDRMKAWGLDYGTIRKINPRIIYISLSGFPSTGGLADLAGHDLNFLGLSGALEATGTPERPVIPAIQIADVLGAYNVVITLLLALLNRQQQGEGAHYRLSLLESVISAAQLQMAQHQVEPEFVKRGRGILSGGMAAYNVYQCQDGGFIALAAVEPKFWETFCNAIGHPEWTDIYFLEGNEQQSIIQAVAEVISQHPRSYWEALGKKFNMCLTPVLSFSEVIEWLNNNKSGVIFKETQNIPAVFPPFVGSTGNTLPAPALGEHTFLLLKKLGLTEESISSLQQKGII